MKWFKKVVFENYANFKGRARRAEYWWFYLVSTLIGLVLGFVALFIFLGSADFDALSSLSETATDAEVEVALEVFFGSISGSIWIPIILLAIYSLLTFIPSIAVLVRRLHDQDKSGWFYFISFIPAIGPLILLAFLFIDGTPGPNRYGPSPKFDNPGNGGPAQGIAPPGFGQGSTAHQMPNTPNFQDPGPGITR